MAPILQVKNLDHIYSIGTPFEHQALKDVSFQVERGEFIGIIGHTGSGKSTLMQQLHGLLKPTSGQVLLDGVDIWSDKKLTRQARFRVGLVFQYPEYQLFEETVYKDIAFGPRNMGLSKEEIDRRVREAADFVGITEEQLQRIIDAILAGKGGGSDPVTPVDPTDPVNPVEPTDPWVPPSFDFTGLLKGLMNLLAAIFGLISNLVGYVAQLIADLVTSLNSVIDNIKTLINQGVIGLFSAMFPFLPPEITSLLSLTFLLVAIIAVIKALRG